ncbi:MAG: hypothetical protein GY844_31055 [Bradyrhizobium sp.]|nr:hypothetical protein [Bradyrhizobium sp.]
MLVDNRAIKASAASVRAAGVLLGAGLCLMASMPGAMAQVIVPGINAPPVLPAPTPSIQIPQIPQAGVPSQPAPLPALQNTYPDRVNTCIQMGAAAGLSGGGLNAYTGLCASQ